MGGREIIIKKKYLQSCLLNIPTIRTQSLGNIHLIFRSYHTCKEEHSTLKLIQAVIYPLLFTNFFQRITKS